MLDFSFYSPTYFAFGRDAEARTGELASRFAGHKVLVHYGQGSVIRSGLLGRVVASLEEAGLEVVQLGGAVPNPVADKVYEGIELGRREKVDMVIGVGGGSAVDSAKAIAVGIPYDGDFWDFYEGDAKVQEGLPVGCVLTLAATGTEGSNSSVITNVQKDNKKRGLSSDLLRPVFSVLNPELMYTLPAYQTACGIADMMAHILERYLSNTRDVELTDRLSEAVLKTILHQGPSAIREPENYEARAALMWAGMVAHNDLLGCDREQDWSSHQMEHELSALYGVAHGAGLAVVMPAFMAYTLDHDPARYAQLAERVFGVEADYFDLAGMGREGIARFRRFLQDIGLPVSLTEIDVPAADIPLLARRVKRNNGDRVGYFQPLDNDDLEAVYRLAL